MKITVRLSGWMSQLAGLRELELEVAEGAVLGEALGAVAAMLPPEARARLGRNGSLHPSVIPVLRGELAPPTAVLEPGDEIELILPVAGG